MKRKSIREHLVIKKQRREEKRGKKRSAERMDDARAWKLCNTQQTNELYDNYRELQKQHNLLFLQAEEMRKQATNYQGQIAVQNDLILRGVARIKHMEALLRVRAITKAHSCDVSYDIIAN